MNRLNLQGVKIPQTSGQTLGLTRQRVNPVFYNEKLIKNSKTYHGELSPPWSSSVADPSHSPIERGQRHGPLRREKKVRNKINNRIDRISKKIRIKTKIKTEAKKQLKGPICVIQLKGTMTRNINQFQSRGVDG
ncbi:MAG: hypothetical protein B7Y39_18150 [Bdellovibrio sp. 28-41-41]|nr:MAG: hypothetical protein B7Y39_18150 [Bdellovibrio sp. 28-41-41]